MNSVYAEKCAKAGTKQARQLTPNWATSAKLQLWTVMRGSAGLSPTVFRLRSGNQCIALDYKISAGKTGPPLSIPKVRWWSVRSGHLIEHRMLMNVCLERDVPRGLQFGECA